MDKKKARLFNQIDIAYNDPAVQTDECLLEMLQSAATKLVNKNFAAPVVASKLKEQLAQKSMS